MFISFEGIDGSGKSTQARLLGSALRQSGHAVREVREPGGTPLGEDVRTLLLDPTRTVNPRAELLLFAAARAQLVETVIRPALDRGDIVIADRFSDSTVAYQGGGRSVQTAEWIEAFSRFVTADVIPHRTYFIDVPVLEALSRRSSTGRDRMEQSGLAFYERVRATYMMLSQGYPERIVRLDGTQPIDALQLQVLDDVHRARPSLTLGS